MRTARIAGSLLVRILDACVPSKGLIGVKPRSHRDAGESRKMRFVAYAGGLLGLTLLAAPCAAQTTDAPQKKSDVADLGKSEVSPPGLGLARWINPATAPFIPVPVIGTDPNSGTTLGILPTWVHTNENDEISRIIAPDFVHNPNFGYGAHGRIFDYPSDNEQWSVVAGIQQRVQRLFDAEYQTELSRQQLWSINYSLIFNRDGTPRYFGLGDGSSKHDETDYTKVQELAQLQVGLNLSHAWQLLYTLRPQRVDVQSGTLQGIPSIETLFPAIDGLGVSQVLLNRLSIVYDTRDNLVVPRQGMEWVAYGGLASRSGLLNDSLYSEAGIDGRAFWVIEPDAVLAAHASLRYMPSTHRVPFWALSSIGGDRDEIGGTQELRGYGAGRYYDRNSFAATLELRKTMLSFDAASSHIDVEVTPFLDVGSVFAAAANDPLTRLHKVVGLGFRGVARPFVVGYVDIGYGNEGVAAFTGINYPF